MLGLLLSPGKCQFAGWHITADGRTRADRCPIADLHRRYQCTVRADKGIVANHCLMLVSAIIIAGDHARTDICPLTNLRIT